MTKKKNVKTVRICLSTLKSRGWTDKLIEKFAPEPMYAPNPHYKCSSDMKLFYLNDIERIEKHKKFKVEFETVQKKKERAKYLADTKEERCLAALNKRLNAAYISINPECDLRKLALEAKADYFRQRHNSCLWAYHNVPWVVAKSSSLPSPYDYDDIEYDEYGNEIYVAYEFKQQVAETYVYDEAVPEEDIKEWMVDYILFYQIKFGSSTKINYGTLRSEIQNRTKISFESRQEQMFLLNKKVYSLIAETYPDLKDACIEQLKFKGITNAEELIYGSSIKDAG